MEFNFQLKNIISHKHLENPQAVGRIGPNKIKSLLGSMCWVFECYQLEEPLLPMWMLISWFSWYRLLVSVSIPCWSCANNYVIMLSWHPPTSFFLPHKCYSFSVPLTIILPLNNGGPHKTKSWVCPIPYFIYTFFLGNLIMCYALFYLNKSSA